MSKRSSEQLLSSLEHSQKPAVELLNDAADILKLSWKQIKITDTLNRSSNDGQYDPKFREQWVLKWLIKRLGHAVGSHDRQGKKQATVERGQQDESLIQDSRMWLLLSHLLTSIPLLKVQEILADRNFCQIFDAVIALTLRKLDDSFSPAIDQISTTSIDDESEPLRKKRRLSKETVENEVKVSELSWPLLARLLINLANQCAAIFYDNDSTLSKTTTVAWADNIDGCSVLVGNIIRLISLVLNTDAESHPEIYGNSLDVIDRWLYLWNNYISSGHSNSKHDPHTSFNSFILIPALSVLSLKAKALTKERFKVLERQIAVQTMVSARSEFEKQPLARGNLRNDILRDKDIEQLVRGVQRVLQPAADDFSKPEGVIYASLLLDIASRLIPRSDAVRRKVESRWFEILFLCLIQLVQKSTEPSGPDQSAAPSRIAKEQMTERLVDAFLNLSVVPSNFVWHYFNKHYVVTKDVDPSYTLLEKTVRLNATVFADNFAVGYVNLGDELHAQLPLTVPLTVKDSQSIVVKMLRILLDEYGKTRQFPKFLELWKSKLAETFHDRTVTASTSPDQQRRYIWDDPDMLEAFTVACRQYAPPSLCREILGEALKGLQTLPTIVGPTHQIFVQLTIATQVLKSGVVQISSEAASLEQLQDYVKSICLALARPTDYQGHRWKLYNFLATILRADSRVEWTPFIDASKIIDPLVQNAIEESGRYAGSQISTLSMERFHCLNLLISSIEARHTGIEPLFKGAIDMINSLLENLLKESASLPLQSSHWDGTIEGIAGLDAFLSACIIRVATLPASWFSYITTSERLLINLTKVVFCVQSSSTIDDSCLLSSTETLLRLLVTSPVIETPTVVLQTVVNQTYCRIRRIPTLLWNLLSQNSQSDVQDVRDVLLENLGRAHSALDERLFSDSLALLSNLTTDTPSKLRTKNSFKNCVLSLQKPSSTADLMIFILNARHVEKLARSIVEPSQSIEALQEWRKKMLNICKIIKKETKTLRSSENQRLLDNYADFLLLFIVAQLHDSDLKQDEKMDKLIRKIESQLRKATLREIPDLLEDESNVMVVLKGTTLLNFLLDVSHSADCTTKNTVKVQKLYQKIKTCITAAALHGPDYLKSLVLKHAKTEIDRLATSNQTIFNLTLSPVLVADDGMQRVTRGDFEIQAALALDASRHISSTSYTPLVTLIATGNKDAFQASGMSDDTKLLFAVAAIARNINSDTLSSSLETVKAFGQIASLESALKGWNPIGLVLRLELSQFIFDSHPTIINQHIIDTTLSNVTLLACSANKLTLDFQANLNNPHPQHIFDRLCQILITILTRYRRRLSGRHHLLLTSLQCLLKCLFYPPTRQHMPSTTNINTTTTAATAAAASNATFLSSLPNWLNPPSHTSPYTLPATSAIKFSRILQILCDPSTSSARRVSKRRRNPSTTAIEADQQDLNLVDEVRLLRRQVSQHTQYLLQTYCQAMLDGWISPEAKEKLTLGLYAVCNATDVEVMRGMNSAMNENQRAIWKDLYADWTRWGKWNQR